MKSQALIHEAATRTLFTELEGRARATPQDKDDVKRGAVRLVNALKKLDKERARD